MINLISQTLLFQRNNENTVYLEGKRRSFELLRFLSYRYDCTKYIIHNPLPNRYIFSCRLNFEKQFRDSRQSRYFRQFRYFLIFLTVSTVSILKWTTWAAQDWTRLNKTDFERHIYQKQRLGKSKLELLRECLGFKIDIICYKVWIVSIHVHCISICMWINVHL